MTQERYHMSFLLTTESGSIHTLVMKRTCRGAASKSPPMRHHHCIVIWNTFHVTVLRVMWTALTVRHLDAFSFTCYCYYVYLRERLCTASRNYSLRSYINTEIVYKRPPVSPHVQVLQTHNNRRPTTKNTHTHALLFTTYFTS
jgi:hypothetical protein